MVQLNLYDYANIFDTFVDSDGYSYYNLITNLVMDGELDSSLYTEIFYNETESWYELSNKYYGTTRLWWVFLLVNNVVNPFEDVKTGDKIKVLNSNAVSEILSGINSQNG